LCILCKQSDQRSSEALILGVAGAPGVGGFPFSLYDDLFLETNGKLLLKRLFFSGNEFE
jgi:hypothetical protein